MADRRDALAQPAAQARPTSEAYQQSGTWQEAVARGERPQRPPSPKRHRVMQQGRVVCGPDTLIACIVRDLTPVGAKIRLPRPVPLPEMFELVIAAHDLRTIPVRLCWQRGDFAGVTFLDSAVLRDRA